MSGAVGQLQATRSGQVTADGTANPITVPGPTTVLYTNVPETGTFPVAGRVLVWGQFTIDKSVLGDRFATSILNGTSTIGLAYGSEAQDIVTLNPTGSFAVAASTVYGLSLKITRASGSGAANSIESPAVAGLMHWLFIPAP